MLFAFLLYGTAWFWLALAIPALLLIWFIENERAIGALLTVLITVAVFVAFGDKNLLPWILANPLTIAAGVGVYLVAGVVWGIIKWFFHVLRSRDKYEAFRKDFLENQNSFFKNMKKREVKQPNHQFRTKQTDEEHQAALAAIDAEPEITGFDPKRFKEYARERGYSLHEFPPHPSKNKGRIIFWMSYWPFSAIWTLINDPITRFYRFLYRRLGKVFEGITNSMYKKYKDDFATSEG